MLLISIIIIFREKKYALSKFLPKYVVVIALLAFSDSYIRSPGDSWKNRRHYTFTHLINELLRSYSNSPLGGFFSLMIKHFKNSAKVPP